jgi:tripartite-type tricarboxylate transporter receptor subunit TctC
MKLSISRLAVAAALFSTAAAFAQTYPARPIRMIVPFPPGGSTDLVARVIAQKMSESWGHQVVVDNRPGANGMIGADLVAKGAPDGYSIVLGTIGPMAINASLYKMPYDIARDLAPITYTANIANVLVVGPSVPAKDVKELVALAKAKPGTLTFGSSGTGGAPHMAVELFKILAKVNVVHVPYKGGGPAMTDAVGGQITGSFASVPSAIGFIKAGKLRALGVSAGKRSSALPEVPTVAEAGVKGFSVLDWQGLFGTAKTPPEIVNKLNAAAVKALADPQLRTVYSGMGIDIIGNTPAQFAKQIREDTARWAKVAKTANVRAD